jgi:transporter family-2 protein
MTNICPGAALQADPSAMMGSMSAPVALLATVLAGAFVALQAPINAKIAEATGKVPSAAVNFLIGALILAVLVTLIGQARRVGEATSVPWYLLLGGGAMGVIYVTTVIFTVRELGAGGATAATITGQLAASLVMDRIGLLGLTEIAITPARIAGCVLLVAGTLLIVR